MWLAARYGLCSRMGTIRVLAHGFHFFLAFCLMEVGAPSPGHPGLVHAADSRGFAPSIFLSMKCHGHSAAGVGGQEEPGLQCSSSRIPSWQCMPTPAPATALPPHPPVAIGRPRSRHTHTLMELKAALLQASCSPASHLGSPEAQLLPPK